MEKYISELKEMFLGAHHNASHENLGQFHKHLDDSFEEKKKKKKKKTKKKMTKKNRKKEGEEEE